MSLVIDIELVTGRYDAADAGDRESAEWPPHPARVFCALVASARSDADREALRWMERLPPPVVQAAPSPTVHVQMRSSYVVTNAVENPGKSQFHPGRINALKRRYSSSPGCSRVRVVWRGVEVAASTVALLDMMARRVPYLGRSTGVVVASVTTDADETVEPPAGLASFEPTPEREHNDAVMLRVPYAGYLDLLIEQFETGRPAWEVSRDVSYSLARRSEEPGRRPAGPAPSPYPDVIVLRFTGVRPDGRLTTVFTEALRRGVMSATEDPLPDALHGHDSDGRPHVAFLALPNADNPRADGHLLGMAVAIPAVPDDQRRAIVRGVLAGTRSATEPLHGEQRLLRLAVPGIGEVDLSYRPGLVRPWGIRPERWRRGSDRWVSVTPVVLDRYPRKGDVEAEIVRSCLHAGLPEPSALRVSTEPLVTGGVRMRPADLPARARGRLFRHVELLFDRTVHGPVLLGAGRYLGVGLMAPRQPQGVEVSL